MGGTSKACAMIVRWNGSRGNFTVLKTDSGSPVSATYSNGAVTAYNNGVAVLGAVNGPKQTTAVCTASTAARPSAETWTGCGENWH